MITIPTNTNTNTNEIEECGEYEHTVLNSDGEQDIKAAAQKHQINKDIDDRESKTIMKNALKYHIEELQHEIGDTLWIIDNPPDNDMGAQLLQIPKQEMQDLQQLLQEIRNK